MTRHLRIPLALIAASLAFAFWFVGAAQAAQAEQMVCGERANMVRLLSDKYGETRRSMGLTDGQAVVEMYASDETGSWSILITDTQGTTCMLAAGTAFQADKLTIGTGA